MTEKILPIPCVNEVPSDNDSAKAQAGIKKIAEELYELTTANDYYYFVRTEFPNNPTGEKVKRLELAREMILEEATDIITATVTLLESLGYDEQARQEMQDKVNKKNKARGYW